MGGWYRIVGGMVRAVKGKGCTLLFDRAAGVEATLLAVPGLSQRFHHERRGGEDARIFRPAPEMTVATARPPISWPWWRAGETWSAAIQFPRSEEALGAVSSLPHGRVISFRRNYGLGFRLRAEAGASASCRLDGSAVNLTATSRFARTESTVRWPCYERRR